jgi:hypothetical protein
MDGMGKKKAAVLATSKASESIVKKQSKAKRLTHSLVGKGRET